MNRYKIYGHGSYIGTTGYNDHTRKLFRELSKYCDIKFRNFTVGKTWKGYSLTPHEDEPYLDDIDRDILHEQILFNKDGARQNYPIYTNYKKMFTPDLNIVLCETNHHIFYDNYEGAKIAYNVWESTLQPQEFFNKLLEFDELWVPSQWQKDVTIKQGYPSDRIKVIPEGVSDEFFPNPQVKHELTSDGRFNFFIAGRWDYRKSTKEMIECFLETFDKDEPIDLIISVDNPHARDGFKTTEDRLDYYGLNDERIKVLHFPSRNEYIDILKSCNAFLSCARSEGWNIPLIEAMACGIPSIYSNCSGQLEFAKGLGIPVEIIGEKPVSESTYNHFNTSIGNYYEPDFNDLKNKLRNVYENYEKHKQKSLKESEIIRENFNWEKVGKIASDAVSDFMNRKPWLNRPKKKNEVIISYLEGPKVEILGEQKEEYFVEFIDKSTNEVKHSGTITNNMWISCNLKYYVPWIIKVDGKIIDEFSLENERVLISLESSALGDTIAWTPYAVDFMKKHNCKVILSTFHNKLFSGLKEYKDIEFVEPGTNVYCKAIYRFGWFKKDGRWANFEKNKNQVNTIPMQQTATDILGLDFYELNYGVNLPKLKKPISGKYVVFAPNATSGCKEWVYEHWVSLSKMMMDLGYKVVTLTKHKFEMSQTINVWGESLQTVANYLHHADIFVGLGSGLSWLNWALGKHTFMINGFSRDGHEFTTNVTRIYNNSTCIFCWNDEEFVFDGGWDWCPVYKGTKKQHICQKSITPLQVFSSISIP
jgi:autotransporter strand-loop-strand O-heptosyltransferase